ncbi:MAG: hypothetical protein HY904_16215 [Deltaproteobacteria bacterium]|nr:hypothetical protein [Deltaproteobacteria bacterium]
MAEPRVETGGGTGRALGALDRALDWLLPLTLLGGVLFAPEWLVQWAFERRLRAGARSLPGALAAVDPHGFLVVEVPGREEVRINVRGTRRVSWMVLPRVWGVRKTACDLVRFDTPAGSFLVENPPAGLTRLLRAAGGRVDTLGYGRTVEWAALAVWWGVLALVLYGYFPWHGLAEAWRTWRADVQLP